MGKDMMLIPERLGYNFVIITVGMNTTVEFQIGLFRYSFNCVVLFYSYYPSFPYNTRLFLQKFEDVTIKNSRETIVFCLSDFGCFRVYFD